MTETLIVCSHGTAYPEGRAPVTRLVQALQREVHPREVVSAYVDVQEPSIDDVVRATTGRRLIMALFLSSGYHVNTDIVRASDLDPMVTAVPALGPDWILAEIGVRRLFEAGAGPDDTIVLASAGSSDQRALGDVSKAARLLSAVWGGRVHVGSIGGAVDIARAPTSPSRTLARDFGPAARDFGPAARSTNSLLTRLNSLLTRLNSLGTEIGVGSRKTLKSSFSLVPWRTERLPRRVSGRPAARPVRSRHRSVPPGGASLQHAGPRRVVRLRKSPVLVC